jgi:ribosomal protein S18 acetylase RimI-like enzyme
MKIQQLHEFDEGTAASLAELCAQLGYPSSPAQVSRRLEAILSAGQHAVFLAMSETGSIVGWVHIFYRPLLVEDLGAEVGGLVVDSGHRGRHIGEELMRAAEAWAAAHGLREIFVRSNISRVEAHSFYPAIGYDALKVSKTYLKSLV